MSKSETLVVQEKGKPRLTCNVLMYAHDALSFLWDVALVTQRYVQIIESLFHQGPLHLQLQTTLHEMGAASNSLCTSFPDCVE